LGPEYKDLDFADLHPRTFVRKHLLEDDDYEIYESPAPKRASTLDYGERPPFDDEAT
ncbi:MAG: sec-independent translocase, partial [Streptosporangiaceae bacterium]